MAFFSLLMLAAGMAPEAPPRPVRPTTLPPLPERDPDTFPDALLVRCEDNTGGVTAVPHLDPTTEKRTRVGWGWKSSGAHVSDITRAQFRRERLRKRNLLLVASGGLEPLNDAAFAAAMRVGQAEVTARRGW